jgi:hypothetical protein
MVIGALLAAALSVVSSTPSESITDLVEVADIKSLAVSPDGRMVAFRTEQSHPSHLVCRADGRQRTA